MNLIFLIFLFWTNIENYENIYSYFLKKYKEIAVIFIFGITILQIYNDMVFTFYNIHT